MRFERIARYSSIAITPVGEREKENFQIFHAINVFISTIFLMRRSNNIPKPKKTPRMRRLGQEGWCKQTLRRKVNSSGEYLKKGGN
jgi:hypothetical protein